MRAGVDNECNTATLSDTAGLPDRYREALERGLISARDIDRALVRLFAARYRTGDLAGLARSEEHTSELQSLMRTSYAVFCLKQKKKTYILLSDHTTI